MPIVHLAPLQGITDFRFRTLFNQYFGGVDFYHSPYMKISGHDNVKPSYQRDIEKQNNPNLTLIPQILTADADEFITMTQLIKTAGYPELNWNLGCPYPMVAKRGMGSGLISQPQKIDDILHRAFNETDLQISIKIRLGYHTPDELFQLLPTLEKYALKHLTIHPRLGKQMYKGTVDLNAFEKCLQLASHTIVYNGDIDSYATWQNLQNRFSSINQWMIGRGAIANPFLPQLIKNETNALPDHFASTFAQFHEELVQTFTNYLSGSAHVIQRMYSYWEYFIQLYPDKTKLLKKIKKSKNMEDYRTIVRAIIEQ